MRGIRWLSLVPDSGYGNAAQTYLSGIVATRTPVSWTPLGWPSERWASNYGPITNLNPEKYQHGNIINIPIDHEVVVVHSMPTWHERLAEEAEGKKLVAFTTWETDRLPDASVAILNRYDQVVVPSRFNADVFRASGVVPPIAVVPHIAVPVDPKSLSKPGEKRTGTFTFYVIATWIARKAILETVSAYLEAFSDSDDVVLVIQTGPVDLIAQFRRRQANLWSSSPEEATWFTLANALSGRTKVPKIVLSTRHLDQEGVDELHRRGDCYVSLSRGEGWGLGAFEAAAFGNPSVVTGWGATPEFLPDHYPYLAEYDLVPTTSDETDAWRTPEQGEYWAKVRRAHAVTLLRQIYENRDEAREWGRTCRGAVLENYASERITKRLLEALAPASR